MGIFNYNRFHYFDKNGNELILKKNSPVRFLLKNTNDPTSQSEYVFVRSLPDQDDTNTSQIAANGLFEKIVDGHRYDIDVTEQGGQSNSLDAIISNKEKTISPVYFAKPIPYKSSSGTQYIPVLSDTTSAKANILSALDIDSVAFPSYTFESKITFEKVSTELVETQSICVLIDNEYIKDDINLSKYTTLYEYADAAANDGNNDPFEYINRFKLFFFIDNREQSDFRLFTTNGSDITWTDRITLNLADQSTDYVFENGFRINIGFYGKQEGVYEQDLYVCLLDTSNDNNIYPIGTIHMSAEAIGEDERYRTFFTNFGIPDPKEYDYIFRETPNIEDGIDYISINKHSKQMFLTYTDIFPYVGTYKALINAVKTLGYDDILFKEWYKELGKTNYEGGKYVTYDINFNSINATTISNVPIEERIHLKKMNWISLFYKINEEVDGPVDKWGFPEVISKSNYYTSNNIVKIISLKKWLEKYIIGVNCRITGISGEGIVFERYLLPKYGGYQQVLDYRNSKPIYPIILNDAASLIDSSALINVKISTTDGGITFEEARYQTFQEYCEGYFDENKKFHSDGGTVSDSSNFVYYGKTFEQNVTYGQIDLVSKCETKHYRLSEGIIDASTASLIIDNDRIIFDPHDLLLKPRTARFTKLPTIQIKKGYIKSYKQYQENPGNFKYFAEISQDSSGIIITGSDEYRFDGQDYITLTPPTYNPGDLLDSSIEIYPISYNLGTNHAPVIKRSKYNNNTSSIFGTQGISEYGEFNSFTYGMVYDTNNVNGIPSFKITGYENEYIAFELDQHFPNMSSTIPTESDYYIEILEGRMIFYSVYNDEDIIINFSQYENKDQKIDIDIYKRHHCPLQYTYWSDTYINKFVPGTTYESFVENYKNPDTIDSVILYNNIANIKVYNEGKYTISAILQDEYNNIFSAKSSKHPIVVTPNINIIGLGGDYAETIVIQPEDKTDASTCIFEYVPKLLIKNIDIDSMIINIYGNATYNNTSHDTGTLKLNGYDKDYKYVNVSNTVDRFNLSITNTHVPDLHDTSTLYHAFRQTIESSNIYSFYAQDTKNISKKESNNDTGNIYDLIKNIVSTRHNYIEGSNADVYIIVLDNVCDKPVGAIAATMCGSYNNDFDTEFEFLLVPYTDIETIWGDIATEYLNNSRYSIYITPAWAIEMNDLKDSSISLNAEFVEHNGIGYPFDYNGTKRYFSGNPYKILYSPDNKKYFGSFTAASDITQSNKILASIDVKNSDKFNDAPLWISPMCCEFTSYKLTGKSFDTSTFTLTLEDNTHNKNIMKYINNAFSISRRNFDIDNAIDSWNIPVSLNTIKYKGEKFEVRSSDNVVFKIDSNQANNQKIETRKWSIYRRNNCSDRELYFECFNNVLFLKNMKQGIYDIELTAYDKYGNKYFKRLDGYLTVK